MKFDFKTYNVKVKNSRDILELEFPVIAPNEECAKVVGTLENEGWSRPYNTNLVNTVTITVEEAKEPLGLSYRDMSNYYDSIFDYLVEYVGEDLTSTGRKELTNLASILLASISADYATDRIPYQDATLSKYYYTLVDVTNQDSPRTKVAEVYAYLPDIAETVVDYLVDYEVESPDNCYYEQLEASEVHNPDITITPSAVDRYLHNCLKLDNFITTTLENILMENYLKMRDNVLRYEP